MVKIGKMVKVKIINGLSGEEISVREGSGGVNRPVTTIPGGKHHILEVNENATFREFIFIESSGLQVKLSSDDLLESGEIKIEYGTGPTKSLVTYSKTKDASSPSMWTKVWNGVRTIFNPSGKSKDKTKFEVLKKQAAVDKQAELDKQKQEELEKQKQAELEKQKQAEDQDEAARKKQTEPSL